jgi:hypothetical protein
MIVDEDHYPKVTWTQMHIWQNFFLEFEWWVLDTPKKNIKHGLNEK